MINRKPLIALAILVALSAPALAAAPISEPMSGVQLAQYHASDSKKSRSSEEGRMRSMTKPNSDRQGWQDMKEVETDHEDKPCSEMFDSDGEPITPTPKRCL